MRVIGYRPTEFIGKNGDVIKGAFITLAHPLDNVGGIGYKPTKKEHYLKADDVIKYNVLDIITQQKDIKVEFNYGKICNITEI